MYLCSISLERNIRMLCVYRLSNKQRNIFLNVYINYLLHHTFKSFSYKYLLSLYVTYVFWYLSIYLSIYLTVYIYFYLFNYLYIFWFLFTCANPCVSLSVWYETAQYKLMLMADQRRALKELSEQRIKCTRLLEALGWGGVKGS